MVKTAIIGGGRGCLDILTLVLEGRLRTMSLEIVCVADRDPEAAGMLYAKSHQIPALADLETAARLPGLDLILEVTGDDKVLERIYQLVPSGVRVMDHVLARVFWDVEQAHSRLAAELGKSQELERQLARDRRDLQEILDSMPDVVAEISRERKIERVNARFVEVTGIGRDRAVGMDCCQAMCQARGRPRPPEMVCCWEEVLRTGAAVALVRYHPADGQGEESYAEVTANPVRNEAGEIIRIVETSRPITEQVKLKRETEENERRFRQFLDAAYDQIVMKDLAGRYFFINRQAAAMFGKQPEDFLGKTDAEVLPEGLAERIFAADREVMSGGRHVSRQEQVSVGDKKFYLDTVRFPLFDYKEDVIGVASISRDVTAQKKLQRELVMSERLAAVGKLAAGVAHEINNPLTGILTFTESLLLEAAPDDPRREDYDIIMRETMRCRRIVRDLLDYSRLEKPQRERSDLNRLVERAVSLVAKQAEFHDVRFIWRLAPYLPPVSVDPNQIQQAILNLVINAKDAMDKRGEITLETWRDPDRPRVSLKVIDRGAGIAAAKLKTIFEPFYTTKGAEGNGLGLPVVVSILEQHGGEVAVASEAGVGSAFTLSLPESRPRGGEEKEP